MSESNRREFLGNIVAPAVGLTIAGWNGVIHAQTPRAPTNVRIGDSTALPPTPTPQPGVPSITAVSGSLTDGATITIAGSSFGTKANPAPTLWTRPTFESAAVDTLAGNLGYAYNAGGWHPRITSAVVRPCRTKSMHCQFLAPEYGSSWGHVNPTRVMGFYLDYWVYLVDGPPGSRNIKQWWFIEWPTSDYGIVWQVTPNQLIFSPGYRYWYDVPSRAQQTSQWYHMQAWIVEGSPDTPNGTAVVYYNAQPVIENDSYSSYRAVALNRRDVVTCSTANSNRRAMLFGNYYATDSPVTNGHTYWSDVYYDIGTCARVELGDRSAYGSCAYREIQVPYAWSASQISLTVNRGMFRAGTAYLFVTDSAGTTSAGYPVALP